MQATKATETAEAGQNSAKHTPDCASLPTSKATKTIGACYCDCGASETWRLWEQVDGTCTVFPTDTDPDDLAFARVKPLCIIPVGTPFSVAKLIESAPALLTERDALKAENAKLREALAKLLREVQAHNGAQISLGSCLLFDADSVDAALGRDACEKSSEALEGGAK